MALENKLKQMTNRNRQKYFNMDDSDSSTDDQSEGDNYEDSHIERRARTKRIHKTNDETCGTGTTCTFPNLKELFFGKNEDEK